MLTDNVQAISHVRAAASQAGISSSSRSDRPFGADALRQCDPLFRRTGIVIEPVTVEQAHVARQAFHDFGRGRNPAELHFCDCFACSLAKVTGEPLLFKGDDFKKTDVLSAL